MKTSIRPKLRLLGLHGFRTNGAILRRQVERAKLFDDLPVDVELVCLDGPIPAAGDPEPSVLTAFPGMGKRKLPSCCSRGAPDALPVLLAGPYYEWANANKDPETGKWVLRGARESLAYIESFVRDNGPFDGIVGFSQGTVVGTILAGLQQHGMALQDCPPFRCMVLICGLPSRDKELFPEALQGGIEVPSVHVVGQVRIAFSFRLRALLEEPR